MSETLEDRIMAYLRASIAQRGGAGRRPSKIEYEIAGPAPTAFELGIALRALEAAGKVRFEHNEIMGTYVVLVEAEHA